MRTASLLTSGLILAAAAELMAACASAPMQVERKARDRLDRVRTAYRPDGIKPSLPSLTSDSPPETFILYAILNHPAVEAAWQDWRASIETITTAGALPDPKLTFQADIADTLMTLMPGTMFDLMTPGKRASMAREAAATSNVAYWKFVAQVQRTATELRKAWIDVAYVNEAMHLHHAMASALTDAGNFADADYATGNGTRSLGDQLRFRNEAAMHRAQHESLVDREAAAHARFKAALGIDAAVADPAWPDARLTATTLPSDDDMWKRVTASNPSLAVMRAMVDMTLAGIDAADRSRTPDFALGGMVDLKADPLMFRPQASLSLPVWRAKIRATIAHAAAQHDAAAARLSAEQVDLAAEVAQMLYMVRDSDRMIGYLDHTALPNLNLIIDSADADYVSGMGSATMIAEARAKAVEVQLQRLDTLREREDAVTDLIALMGASAPATPPFVATNGQPSP